MPTADDFTALWITAQLAAWTTAILLAVGTPLAWWLAWSRWRGRVVIEAIVALPLVLPPTVLGFYLLVALGARGPLGAASLAFTFEGLVVGSVIYSLPFVVQPLQDTFRGIGRWPLEVAATLRASPVDRFCTVIVPMAGPGFLTAAILGFAHTLGEFGVVLMVGGNVPGETRVLSIAVYEHVESLQYARAHWVAGGLLLASFALLVLVYRQRPRFPVARP